MLKKVARVDISVSHVYKLHQRVGLRSTSIGEQSEAIVQLPSLINQYPFPILINNAFLKLAEVFRTGYVNWH